METVGMTQIPSGNESQRAGDEPKYAVIMFADIMNSSQLSDSLPVQEYDDVVEEFQTLSRATRDTALQHWEFDTSEYESSSVGDEMKVFIVPHRQEPKRIAEAVAAAAETAIQLKMEWLNSGINVRRILDEDKVPTDLGIGIHVGPVVATRSAVAELHCEGYAINLGKRVEGASREGRASRIVLSNAAHFFLMRGGGFDLDTEEMPRVDMKGILEPPRLFEIVGFTFALPRGIVPRVIARLDPVSRQRLADASQKAMITTRQLVWYGMLSVALSYDLAIATGSQELMNKAVDLAETIVRQEENLSLYRFLGSRDVEVRPDRVVMFNEKALRLDPYDYMAQFNLAVGITLMHDLASQADGQSLALRRRGLEEFKKAELIANAKGYFGQGGELEWRLPLSLAHAYKELAVQSLRERAPGVDPGTGAFNGREVSLLTEAIQRYDQARRELDRHLKTNLPDTWARWVCECLQRQAEAIEWVNRERQDEARRKYEEAVSIAENTADKTANNWADKAKRRLEQLRGGSSEPETS